MCVTAQHLSMKWCKERNGGGCVEEEEGGGSRGHERGRGGSAFVTKSRRFCVSHEERRHGGGQRFSGTFSAAATAFDFFRRSWIIAHSAITAATIHTIKSHTNETFQKWRFNVELDFVVELWMLWSYELWYSTLNWIVEFPCSQVFMMGTLSSAFKSRTCRFM